LGEFPVTERRGEPENIPTGFFPLANREQRRYTNGIPTPLFSMIYDGVDSFFSLV
jgi:hypothetical protein